MLESHLSRLSSLKDDFKLDDYVQPHYREAYRLSIDALVSGGHDAYQEVLKAEKVGAFLSEAEVLFISQSTEQPAESHHSGEVDGSPDSQSSSGTYWPTHSDVPTPNLELGWPNFIHDRIQTKVELLFHPPRQNGPTIKEVIRKHIQDAQEVIAIAMDVFTDVDIFKELVDASARGVPVYVLLDHSQFKSFLTMAESQDIHIHKLTNMRVRTVKGQDYLCRTGAKFHGSMEQRFLLVDCRTVFFGSYSLMWSYEKINLSMIQVITGHLVASYDEEFRTLYARSTIPPELAPLNSTVNERNQGGRVESDAFDRKHQLRHTLNTVYRQACERKDFGSRMGGIEEQPLNYEPFNRESRMMHHQQHDYTSAMDAMSYLKRHSYAGERQEGTYTPAYMRHGASNWNIAGNRGYGNHGRYQPHGGYNDPHHAPPLDNARGSYIRQSYHGTGKQFQSMQQNMPSLDQVTKSYMRDWRVESYLNNSDAPIVENHDNFDQLDLPENRPSLHLHSRLRSSIVLKTVIPEQTEINSYTDASSSSVRCRDQYGVPPSKYTQSPPSIKWNNHEPMDYRAMHDDFLLKRRSLQILDEPKYSGTGNSSGRDYLRSCTSLGRVRGRMVHQEVDAQQEALYKRHSVADPKSNAYVGHREASNPTLGALIRAYEDRGSTRENVGGRRFANNLSEDQQSVSHRNFNGAVASKTSPSRTSSTTPLELQDREQERSKTSSISSPQFLKKSSRKIKSLLNIADKKDGSPKSRLRSLRKVGGGSSDTIVSEDEQQADNDTEGKECSSTADSVRSTGGPGWWKSHTKLHNTDHKDILTDVGRSSTPRFSTEGIDLSPTEGGDAQGAPSQRSNAHSVRSSATTREARHWDHYGESRRFVSSNAPERRPVGYSQRNDTSTNSQANYRYRGLTAAKKDHTDRTNYSDRNAHFSHENKLGRLFQRVGNFIHKKT